MAGRKKKEASSRSKTDRNPVTAESLRAPTDVTESAIPYERAIFRGSSRLDDHNVRATFYLQNENREVETIEPVERIRDLKPGTECGILVGDGLGRSTLQVPLPSLPPQDIGWSHSPTFLMDIVRIQDNAYQVEHVVFKRKMQTKEFGTLAIFSRSSGDDVAIAVLPNKLERLAAGDVCEIIFFKDSEQLAEGIKGTLEVDGFPFDSRANFLQVVRKASSLEYDDVLSSLQQLPVPVLEEIPTEQVRREPERAPTADEILAEIAKVQKPIVDKLNLWLATFIGSKLSCEGAEATIAEIRRVIAKAGCELFFEGQRVGIHASTPEDRVNAKVHVTTLAGRPVRTLYARAAFPELIAQPIE